MVSNLGSKFSYPYNLVSDHLSSALADLNIPRKEAIDWQLINMIERAMNFLRENDYFYARSNPARK